MAAPEGPSHDELIDQYHDALAYGDFETAKTLYKELQNHRYVENMQRTRSEGEASKLMSEYVATAKELSAKHPELGEDGIAVDKVMALVELYRSHGENPAQALRMAVSDLYPEAAVAEMVAPEAPPAAPAEETPPVAEAPTEEAPVEEAPKVEAAAAEKTTTLPDMTERKARKATLSVVPTASARSPEAPKEEAPTRSKAIADIRKARGQA